MCILFYFLNDNPAPGEYRLVLANNRDEFLERPTQPADFWAKDKNILSGLDLVPEREGGTWLGVSKQGKIGSLLNVIDKQSHDELGRGHLVSDYLSSKLDGKSYMQELEKSATNYRPFSLITMELNLNSPSNTQYLCHCTYLNELQHAEFGTGIYGFANTSFSMPWKKVGVVEEKMTVIIEENNFVSQEKILVEKLLEVLNDKTPCMPDETLEKCVINCFGDKKEITDSMDSRSAISVWLQDIKCTSRTNTIFLVDAEWNCVYIERTVEDFSDMNNLKWNTRKFRFKMTPFDKSFMQM